MHVAGQAIELGHRYRATLALACVCERSRKLRPAIESIGTLAGLHLDILGDDFETFGDGEPSDGLALCLKA